jgi:menaquinone-specific isochorismate synthase
MIRDLLLRLMQPTNLVRTGSVPLSLLRTDDDAAFRHWSGRVGAALDAIKRAEFEKVVLTRFVKVKAPRAFSLGRMLGWLETRYPGCSHFAIPLAGKTLVGVTPERLISVTDAIAGTRARRSGHSPPDEGINPLFDDLKTRREQRLVVDGILRALKPVSHDLITAKQPLVLTLPNVQHLWSPIQARIHSDITLLDLAARLHPTPAVSGMPRDRALLWLKNRGEQWRGWYTGALGWATQGGEGELAVVLRCALLEGDEATLFAGAGILRESDPQQEFLETEWKLQSMLDALEHA